MFIKKLQLMKFDFLSSFLSLILNQKPQLKITNQSLKKFKDFYISVLYLISYLIRDFYYLHRALFYYTLKIVV